MQQILDVISKAAPTDVTMLLRGESGVGKEMVARAIHLNSSRSGGALIDFHCGAYSSDQVEGELFGTHSGAQEIRKGKMEIAQGGTLYMDEIDELPLGSQGKLLAVLEDRKFVRVGGEEEIAIDVRMVAATQRNLSEAVSQGTFRPDLYERLRGTEIYLPSLRERREDIVVLADHFLGRFAQKIGRRVTGFTPETKALLRSYDWPGNVRELMNVLERALFLSKGLELTPEDFPSLLQIRLGSRESGITLEELEREAISQVLKMVDGNVAEASRILGVNRSSLYEKMAKYRL
jgi:two-component system response regulator HydG